METITTDDIQEINKTVRKAHHSSTTPIWIQPIPIDKLTLIGFVDAAWAVRKCNKSQGWFMVLGSHEYVLIGKEIPVSTINFKSFRLPSVVRPSLAVETCALT